VKVQAHFKNSADDTASFLNQELMSLQRMKDIVNQKLEQLTFEEKRDVYRIAQHDRAGVPKATMNGDRPRDMVAASLGLLWLVLGAFLTREFAATRIAAGDLTPRSDS
jgi:hypothetical protein